MKGIVKIGDVGIGGTVLDCSKSGTVVDGFETIVDDGGLSVAGIASVIVSTDGHTGIMIDGSSKVISYDGLGITRMSDPFSGAFTGTMVTGSQKTFINDMIGDIEPIPGSTTTSETTTTTSTSTSTSTISEILPSTTTTTSTTTTYTTTTTLQQLQQPLVQQPLVQQPLVQQLRLQ